MPPRPHSPDCLLWAKNLKDEHTKLKVRISGVENTVDGYRLDIENLKSSIETRRKDDDGLHASHITTMQHELVQLGEKVKIQENKIRYLERTNTELREDHEETHQTNEELWDRLKAHEAVIDGFPRMSPKFLRKNDTSSTTALARMVEVMRNGQQNDHQTIQKLQAQVHGLTNLFDTRSHRTASISPEKTPSVTNSSSPLIQVAGSPLLERQGQVLSGQLFKHTLLNVLRDISPTKRVANKALGQPAVAALNQSLTKVHKGRAEAAKATTERSTQPEIANPAQRVKQTRQRRSASIVSQRQTRSQKRASDSGAEAPPAARRADTSEQTTTVEISGVPLPNVRLPLEHDTVSTKIDQVADSRTIVAHCQRKRRKVSLQPALPPLEDMSE